MNANPLTQAAERAQSLIIEAQEQRDTARYGHYIEATLDLVIGHARQLMAAPDDPAATYHQHMAEHYWARCPHSVMRRNWCC